MLSHLFCFVICFLAGGGGVGLLKTQVESRLCPLERSKGTAGKECVYCLSLFVVGGVLRCVGGLRVFYCLSQQQIICAGVLR